MKGIVLGFDVDKYNKYALQDMSDNQLYETALEDNDVVIYDCVDDFFTALNDDLVDTENYYWENCTIE